LGLSRRRGRQWESGGSASDARYSLVLRSGPEGLEEGLDRCQGTLVLFLPRGSCRARRPTLRASSSRNKPERQTEASSCANCSSVTPKSNSLFVQRLRMAPQAEYASTMPSSAANIAKLIFRLCRKDRELPLRIGMRPLTISCAALARMKCNKIVNHAVPVYLCQDTTVDYLS
jgi:hypothetical protein